MKRWYVRPAPYRRFALSLALLAIALMRPVAAMADSLNLFIQEDYSSNSTRTVDSSGLENKLSTSQFTQKYYLNLDKTLFPTMRLNAGGIFEKILTDSTVNDVKTKSNETKPSLFCNLAFASGIYNAGFSYNRRQDTQISNSAARLSMVNEDYNFVFGWKPDGFPRLDLRLGRNNNYDDKYKVQDTTTDTAQIGLRYQPVRPLDLRYSGTYTDTNDRVHITDTKELLQTARVTYSDEFFDKRCSVYLDYKYTNRDTHTKTGGSGEVTFQVFPIAGLSLVETFPNIPTMDTLNNNPALIDGNTATSAGLDIGFSPSASGDTNMRDLGIQFADAVTECDTIYVYVDKLLTPVVATSFKWEIYTSDDNLNWTLWSTVMPAPFNTFQNRFEIRFPGVKSRYLKVVTSPLALGVTTDPVFSDIFVTEMQAFLIVPASEAVGTTVDNSHVVNATAKTVILSSPSLYHDVSLFLTDTTTGQTSLTTYFLTNGLNFYKKFAGLINVNARVAREDSDQGIGHQSAYVYSASATANPLPTLTDSLIYSGRNDSKPTGKSSTNSFTLFNKAELYKGINTYASLGYNFGKLESGQSTSGSLVNVGVGIVPHRTLNVNLAYIYNSTRQSAGGGKPASSATSDRIEGGVTFTPVSALYLFASISRTTTDTRTKVLTNYGLNFSPFPEGNLQLHFSYIENIGPADQGVNRLITPSLRWNIRGGTYLDLSYAISRSRSSISSIDSDTFYASLKVTL